MILFRWPKKIKEYSALETPGIEPGAFHMQSERATTALHPHLFYYESIEVKGFFSVKM